jgi:hypothetical protein
MELFQLLLATMGVVSELETRHDGMTYIEAWQGLEDINSLLEVMHHFLSGRIINIAIRL